jgi:hypothetical protein
LARRLANWCVACVLHLHSGLQSQPVGNVAAFATERWTRLPATVLPSGQPYNRSQSSLQLPKLFIAHLRVGKEVRKILFGARTSRCISCVLTRDPSRSLRKAAPSPLQTSTTATSPPTSATPTRTTFPRSGVDHTSTSTSSNHAGPQEGPRSPKERLDDLLASEKTFYRSEDSSVDSIEENKSRCVPW